MNTWNETPNQLETLALGAERDDYIDTLADHALNLSPSPETEALLDVLLQALALAQREFTVRSTALAIAVIAPAENEDAVDALLTAFRQHRKHAFLAPALLEALTLLALRNPLARLEMAPLLIRITSRDSRYLLIKSAKMITCLDPSLRSTELRQKLAEWRESHDLAVAAEAAVQYAYLELSDTLLAPSTPEFRQRLAFSHVAFVRAAQMEEQRPDAELFACLVEMLLTFYNLTHDRDTTSTRLLELFDQITMITANRWMTVYQSESMNVCISHILGVADALKRAALSANQADDWTNFDEALIELAALYNVIRSSDTLLSDFALTPAVSTTIADTIFVPQLGPVLLETVGRRRLAKIREKYIFAHGQDSYADSLCAFEQTIAHLDHSENNEDLSFRPSPQLLTELSRLAVDIGQTPETMLRSFLHARRHGHDTQWLDQLGIGSIHLPTDNPALFDGNASLHLACQRLSQQLDDILHPYPSSQWMRLIAVLKNILLFASLVFNDLPVYVRCKENGGKGQDASEHDLQDHLFTWLRQCFGDQALYERTPIAGGRVDTGLQFPELLLPIEVKHEFTSIAPEHIQTHYLAQADMYAAAANHVSFLLILDLREIHARKHQDRRTQARRAGEDTTITAQYGWDDGFWIETLPPDPQLPTAKSNAIVIGLIPGNRARPSSTTLYSKRPRKTSVNTALNS